MREDIDRVYGRALRRRKRNRDCVGALRVVHRAALAVQRQRQNQLPGDLLRVGEVSAELRIEIGAPPRFHFAPRGSSTLLLRQPIAVIKAFALVVQALDEQPQPVAVSRRWEIRCQQCHLRLERRVIRSPRITLRLNQPVRRVHDLLERREVHRDELRVHEGRIGRKPRRQPLLVRVERRDDASLALEIIHPLAVAALKERHSRRVRRQHGEAVQPQIHVFVRRDRPALIHLANVTRGGLRRTSAARHAAG